MMEPDYNAFIKCNGCIQGPLDGLCYRVTKCNHIICETCAIQNFSDKATCPICGVPISMNNIQELKFGISPSDFIDSLFQEIFQKPQWEHILQNANRVNMACSAAMTTIHLQLLLEVERSQESSKINKSAAEEFRHEIGKLTLQFKNQKTQMDQKLKELQHQVDIRDRELSELRVAYKEKMRKCSAWEQAYNHMRQQLVEKNPPSHSGDGFSEATWNTNVLSNFNHTVPDISLNFTRNQVRQNLDGTEADDQNQSQFRFHLNKDYAHKILRRTETNSFAKLQYIPNAQRSTEKDEDISRLKSRVLANHQPSAAGNHTSQHFLSNDSSSLRGPHTRMIDNVPFFNRNITTDK